MKNLLYLIGLIFILNCSGDSGLGNYQPVGLRKISEEEMLQKIRNKEFNLPIGIIFKDQEGNIITPERLKAYNEEEYFGDQYVDKNNVLREVVIRKATRQDKEIMARIKAASQQALEQMASEGNNSIPPSE